MDSSISDMFSTSDIFDTSNVTINSNFEHLRLMFEEVLINVSYVDVEENVFKDEIPKLKHACNEVVEQISENMRNIQTRSELLGEIKKLIQRYTNLLNFAHIAVKYISQKVAYFQIQSLPLAICEILLQVFKHCKNSDTFYGNHFVSVSYLLTDLFKKANELQSSFLYLLNNNITFNISAENEIVFLGQVAEILPTIGEIVSGLDIKTTAELWKAYLTLLQKYNEYIKDRIVIETPIKYFCTQITDSLKTADSMSDLKPIEKTLKIVNFNLKIAIKLCSLHECTGDSVEKLFNLLIKLNKYSVPFLRFEKRAPRFIDIMQSYVVVATEPFLNHLLGNRCFVQSYFKNIKSQFEDEDSRLSAIFLTISVMKIILNTDNDIRKLWISDDSQFNIIFTVFSSLELFHAEFCLDYPIQIHDSEGSSRIISLYEYLLVHLVAVIIIFNQRQMKNFQKLLFTSVMQDNFWKSQISADIWIILGRYGNAEFCLDSLRFLINFYNKVQDSNRIEIRFLCNLIRRNYNILSSNHKTQLINMYPVDHFIKLWTVIGIKNEPVLKKKLQHYIDQTTKRIEIFLDNKSVETFISMCEYLNFLSTHEFKQTNEINPTELINTIIELWNLNTDIQVQYVWQAQFLNCRANITTSLVQYFENEDFLLVLQSMKNSCNEDSKLFYCPILKSLSANQIPITAEQKIIFNLISRIFNDLLKTKNVVIKQQALETFIYFANFTCHEEILAEIVADEKELQEELSNYLQKIIPSTNQSRTEYFRMQSKVRLTHKCYEKCFEPLPKRLKTDLEPRIKEIIQNINHNCSNLMELYKKERFSENIQVELNTIVDKLQRMSNK